MSTLRRNRTGVGASAKSFYREPLNLVLLAVLPAVSIQVYGLSLGMFPEVGFLSTVGSLETTGRITGAVFATGALAGILGLFQQISARGTDRRLTICGYPPLDLLLSRFVTVVGVSSGIAAVATVTLAILLEVPLRAPGAAFLGLLLAGLVYAMLGILVGAVLPRKLEGSLVLVILADMDNVLASGIFMIDGSITRFSPLSYPHEVVTRAVLDGTVAVGELPPAGLFLLGFGVAATLAYVRDLGGVLVGGGR